MKMESVNIVIRRKMLMKCPRYSKEGNILIDDTTENKEEFNLINILGENHLMQYLKDTGFYNRI